VANLATLKGEPELSGSPYGVRLEPILGIPELVIVLVIFMLIFGVGKLPVVGRWI